MQDFKKWVTKITKRYYKKVIYAHLLTIITKIRRNIWITRKPELILKRVISQWNL